MSAKTVPGQMNQPEKNDLKGPSYDTLEWVTTRTPDVDYRMGLPLQETTPLANKTEPNNDSHGGSMRTSNEINGGKDIFDGGGTG